MDWCEAALDSITDRHVAQWEYRKLLLSGYSNNLLRDILNQLHQPFKYRALMRPRDVLLILLVSWSYCRNNSVKEYTVACNCHGAVIVSIKRLGRKEVKIKAHICQTLKSILISTVLFFLSVNAKRIFKTICYQLWGIAWKYFHQIYFAVSRQDVLTTWKFRCVRWEIKDNGVTLTMIISTHSV